MNKIILFTGTSQNIKKQCFFFSEGGGGGTISMQYPLSNSLKKSILIIRAKKVSIECIIFSSNILLIKLKTPVAYSTSSPISY